MPRELPTNRPEVWASPAWKSAAVEWLDEQLSAAGIDRSGEVDQPHLRPWATVLRAPTTAGVVWLKAAGPGTAFEAGLYQLLSQVAPDRVLTPLAADPARGWVLLPDGGPSIGDRLDGAELTEALIAALVHYGELQRLLASHVEGLIGMGVVDMRPAVMAERFEHALEVTATAIARRGSDADRQTHRRVADMRPTVVSWCEELGSSRLAASLDHNDLHPWNILGDGAGDTRFYDWGDSVVAHPFAAMLVPLGFVQRQLATSLDDPRFQRARDAYLEVFTDAAPDEDLAATLDLACRVAKIARTLTWDRAVQAARDSGEEIDVEWEAAPLETLASLLDDSYLGGA